MNTNNQVGLTNEEAMYTSRMLASLIDGEPESLVPFVNKAIQHVTKIPMVINDFNSARAVAIKRGQKNKYPRLRLYNRPDAIMLYRLLAEDEQKFYATKELIQILIDVSVLKHKQESKRFATSEERKQYEEGLKLYGEIIANLRMSIGMVEPKKGVLANRPYASMFTSYKNLDPYRRNDYYGYNDSYGGEFYNIRNGYEDNYNDNYTYDSRYDDRYDSEYDRDDYGRPVSGYREDETTDRIINVLDRMDERLSRLEHSGGSSTDIMSGIAQMLGLGLVDRRPDTRPRHRANTEAMFTSADVAEMDPVVQNLFNEEDIVSDTDVSTESNIEVQAVEPVNVECEVEHVISEQGLFAGATETDTKSEETSIADEFNNKKNRPSGNKPNIK